MRVFDSKKILAFGNFVGFHAGWRMGLSPGLCLPSRTSQ
jgi:hypothetical protein